MKYLVMETHPAYAVLLDEEGRFLKAANLGYEVGDRVEQVVELKVQPSKAYPWARALTGLCAAAACCCLAFFGYYQPNYTPYGTLLIQINPDVELTISRTQRVLALEGQNEDGVRLLEGYDHQGKEQDEITLELMERAIEMGYLERGDTISITVESGDGAWKTREETETLQTLQKAYGDWADIRLSRDDTPTQSVNPSPSAPLEIVVPVVIPTPAPVQSAAQTHSAAPSPAATAKPTSAPTPSPVLTPPPAFTPAPTPVPQVTTTPVPTVVPDDDNNDDDDDDDDDNDDDLDDDNDDNDDDTDD